MHFQWQLFVLTEVFLFQAIDEDAEPPNNVVKYEILDGNRGSMFHLNPLTGIVYFTNQFYSIYDVKSEYHINKASDLFPSIQFLTLDWKLHYDCTAILRQSNSANYPTIVFVFWAAIFMLNILLILLLKCILVLNFINSAISWSWNLTLRHIFVSGVLTVANTDYSNKLRRYDDDRRYQKFELNVRAYDQGKRNANIFSMNMYFSYRIRLCHKSKKKDIESPFHVECDFVISILHFCFYST